jgi:hypothetical protein
MLKKLLYALVTFFHLPADAVKMFQLANEISGINKKTLPSELLPLNTIQLSRGLLNYTVFQSRLDWIFPYWAEKQYDHLSLSFIPRSHIGLSMNVTERNWTAVGNPDCEHEPIVDRRGLVTPYKNGWSIDTWMLVDDITITPSKEKDTVQKLINDLPIIETETRSGNNALVSRVYTFKSNLYITAEINTGSSSDVSVVLSIRPFNPEGVSIINSISFLHETNSFLINNKDTVVFDRQPSFIFCSTFEESDSYFAITKGKPRLASNCEYGMANAVAVFKCSKKVNGVLCTYNLSSGKTKTETHSSEESKDYWNNLLQQGARIETPDDKINSLYNFSTATLLMLLDNDTITPGPFTYHQFWIRDAAFMLNALDKLGYFSLTLPVINSFKKYQDKNGYFRSQQGEWDSNGQVLWCTYRHALISNNEKLLESFFQSLLNGVKWIDKTRLRDKQYEGKPYYGLLPAGMSAEHLGLVDYYYWDNFWSLAGIRSFASICRQLNRNKELEYTNSLIHEYQTDLENSIEKVCNEFNMEAVPASCTREVNCGMIGSVSAFYPTQLYNSENKRILATLDFLYSKYFYKGMFFQSFIHSGMNAYLSLHIAHAYLYCGNREKFWEILSSVASHSTGTYTYPEAIHPFTGGGAMGDGHHGWAAAEITLALRDAFIYERFNNSSEFIELVLLAGIPIEWFDQAKPFSIKNAPVPAGRISIIVIPSDLVITIRITFFYADQVNKEKLKLELPVEIEKVTVDGIVVSFINEKQKSFFVYPSVKEIVIQRVHKVVQAVSSSIASSAIKSL